MSAEQHRALPPPRIHTLQAFLEAAFSPAEFLAFLGHDPRYETVAAQLTSVDDVRRFFYLSTRLLFDAGLIDEDFFDFLLRFRPNRREEIAALAASWDASVPPAADATPPGRYSVHLELSGMEPATFAEILRLLLERVEDVRVTTLKVS